MIQFAPEFIDRNRMLVLSEDAGEIVVGTAKTSDRAVRDRAGAVLSATYPERIITFRELGESELLLETAATFSGGHVAGRGDGATAKTDRQAAPYGDIDIGSIDSGAPAITLLNSILLEAKEKRASDIHLERTRDGTLLRLRIDGVLVPERSFDARTGRALAVRIKLLANLNTLETRKPQDGRFSITAGNLEHDIRVSTVPCAGGESAVLRFLDTMDSDISLAKLGFSEAAYRELEKIPRYPQGLVLLTGPTGSGKTTTLAALARECGPRSRKIISIEDPVEYRIPGVVQIQTNENAGLGFSALLRRVLRQDPDILVIGEIRDAETAELAVRAALTGHLVLSTLHTGTAEEAVTRLVDMGTPRYVLDSVIRAVISQRLVRACANAPDAFAPGGRGYSGRIPVVEAVTKNVTIRFSSEIRRLLEKKLTTHAEILRVFGEET